MFTKMKFYTYIIFSASLNKFYIGSTSDIEERIVRHNQKSKGFTGNKSDWILVYSESFKSREEAIEREFQIKKWKSRKMIEKLINDFSA